MIWVQKKPTDWVCEIIFRLINNRYEKMLTTIITSNFDLNQISDRLNDRIASRIAEMCIVKKMIGPDRRLAKNAK